MTIVHRNTIFNHFEKLIYRAFRILGWEALCQIDQRGFQGLSLHLSRMSSDENKRKDKKAGLENPRKTCAQCCKSIEGKFLLRALDQFWHEECLKCSYCSTQLTELSFKFYFKGDLILCKRDYIRLFGATGICSQCFKQIPPLDMVMRAREHIYHLDCFACQVCHYRFCVGDKFYLHYNSVLCEDHYYDINNHFYRTPFFT